jgi:hypothetical protein
MRVSARTHPSVRADGFLPRPWTVKPVRGVKAVAAVVWTTSGWKGCPDGNFHPKTSVMTSLLGAEVDIAGVAGVIGGSCRRYKPLQPTKQNAAGLPLITSAATAPTTSAPRRVVPALRG